MRKLVDAVDEIEPSATRGIGALRRSWPVILVTSLAVAALTAGCSSTSTSSTTSTSGASSTTSTTGLSATAVKALQTALFAVGCYSGTVDGVNGPATSQGIRAFQSAEKLTVDGVYGPNTKAKLVAAASAGTKVCSTATTTTSTSATSTTTSSGSAVPSGATTAINAYQTAHGPPAGTWMITSSQVSSVDPTYVLFHIGPAPGHQTTVQGGYGFVHSSGGTWTVIGFGTAEVGCPPGSAQAPVVPAAVLTGFGVSCPPAS